MVSGPDLSSVCDGGLLQHGSQSLCSRYLLIGVLEPHAGVTPAHTGSKLSSPDDPSDPLKSEHVSPVYDVTGAQQSCGVNDRVPDRTRPVELWVLANQMTGQEPPVRTAYGSHAFGVQGDVGLQSSQHRPLKRSQAVMMMDGQRS